MASHKECRYQRPGDTPVDTGCCDSFPSPKASGKPYIPELIRNHRHTPVVMINTSLNNAGTATKRNGIQKSGSSWELNLFTFLPPLFFLILLCFYVFCSLIHTKVYHIFFLRNYQKHAFPSFSGYRGIYVSLWSVPNKRHWRLAPLRSHVKHGLWLVAHVNEKGPLSGISHGKRASEAKRWLYLNLDLHRLGKLSIECPVPIGKKVWILKKYLFPFCPRTFAEVPCQIGRCHKTRWNNSHSCCWNTAGGIPFTPGTFFLRIRLVISSSPAHFL